jgi:hypothetical protein
MSEETKYFPKGLYFNLPRDGAPDFVKGQVSIKVADLVEYLGKVKGEWLNIDLKVSKDGKPYAEVNTWKPDPNKTKPEEAPRDEPEADDDLPF